MASKDRTNFQFCLVLVSTLIFFLLHPTTSLFFYFQYEHRLSKGNKAIYHIEAFVAKFMAVYLKFIEETMMD